MPTYTYYCENCDETTDLQHSMLDETEKTCTECEGVLRKRFHATPTVFKGRGFHTTDNRGFLVD